MRVGEVRVGEGDGYNIDISWITYFFTNCTMI